MPDQLTELEINVSGIKATCALQRDVFKNEIAEVKEDQKELKAGQVSILDKVSEVNSKLSKNGNLKLATKVSRWITGMVIFMATLAVGLIAVVVAIVKMR